MNDEMIKAKITFEYDVPNIEKNTIIQYINWDELTIQDMISCFIIFLKACSYADAIIKKYFTDEIIENEF